MHRRGEESIEIFSKEISREDNFRCTPGRQQDGKATEASRISREFVGGGEMEEKLFQ
jgi:hypothetical protein